MRLLVAAAVLALAAASVVTNDSWRDVVITKEPMVNVDVKTKEICVLKLLNHILQPTMYDDVREVAREYVLEENVDKYLKVDVVKDFLVTYKMGMLPRGEVFVNSNTLHIKEAILVCRMLYFAKDFDTFLRTACWLRERINSGMFVYCLTIAVFHRTDCNGVVLPSPYEIYPFLFVDSNVIRKAHMLKMTKGWLDPVLKDYYGITVKDDKLAVIDWRKGVRYALTQNDRLAYFTEDVDLNTYFYYLHINYPNWMMDDVYNVNKERRGEVTMYAGLQLLARLRLERLANKMCDIKPFMLNKPEQDGYWPKLMLDTGDELPVRYNNVDLVTEDKFDLIRFIEDCETILRDVVFTGGKTSLDGTVYTVKKPEDVEVIARLVIGGASLKSDVFKEISFPMMFKKLLRYSFYNRNKYTYVPTALDMDRTCLRDPVCWKIMKRVSKYFVFFKTLIPKYSREELEYPGVKVERIVTDDLVTFMDEYDMDITNAVYLDQSEMKKRKSDMVFVARMRRLNHYPFKVTVDVVSDKAVDAVVRVFLGPRFDCMGRLLSDVNDIRLDMVELDSFVYKLETGKNVIVRDSREMHGIIEQRPWTLNMWQRASDSTGMGVKMVDSWWYKSRMGFPHRLMLPLGTKGGFPLQLFVIVTPVRTGRLMPIVDVTMMKQRHICPWASCVDSMPLGFPFDRPIEPTRFYLPNMRFQDVLVYRKDLDLMNKGVEVNLSEMVMKRDDLTYLDADMLVRRSYRDVMLMSTDNMTHM